MYPSFITSFFCFKRPGRSSRNPPPWWLGCHHNPFKESETVKVAIGVDASRLPAVFSKGMGHVGDAWYDCDSKKIIKA